MSATMIEEGKIAPDFELPDQTGKLVKLSSFRGRKVVLYFYSKDDTPGCTREACSFRDSMADLKGRGAEVIGISRDDKLSHQKFIEKYSLPFILLSDEQSEVCKLYDVYKLKNMYGKESMGIVRSTFAIDEQGNIKKIFRKVSVDGHAQEVLQAIGG